MSRQEKKQQMAEAFKKAGYNSRQVSIRARRCTYSSSFEVTVRDPKISLAEAEFIANHFESIRYDQYTGEILSGGNDYVFVEREKGMPFGPAPQELVDNYNKNSSFDFQGFYLSWREDHYDIIKFEGQFGETVASNFRDNWGVQAIWDHINEYELNQAYKVRVNEK